MKTKIVRIKEEDYQFFRCNVGKVKNSRELFTKVKNDYEKGKQMRILEQQIKKLGEGMYGKPIWNKMFKK